MSSYAGNSGVLLLARQAPADLAELYTDLGKGCIFDNDACRYYARTMPTLAEGTYRFLKVEELLNKAT